MKPYNAELYRSFRQVGFGVQSAVGLAAIAWKDGGAQYLKDCRKTGFWTKDLGVMSVRELKREGGPMACTYCGRLAKRVGLAGNRRWARDCACLFNLDVMPRLGQTNRRCWCGGSLEEGQGPGGRIAHRKDCDNVVA